MTNIGAEKLLTAAQAAEHLAVSIRTIHRLKASGDLPVVHIGRCVRIRPNDLKALTESALSGQKPRIPKAREKGLP